MAQKYQILVGRDRGNNAISGFLEKGQHIIKGKETPVSIRPGVYGMPNGVEAWGIRLTKDGREPDSHLQVDDPNYNGKIKFVKWGTKDSKATMIRCRYVPGHSTIDKDYQDLRLKVQINDSAEYAGLIVMQHGYNEYDEAKDAALVQMLRIHHFNPKSDVCNPDSYPAWTYAEINQNELDQKNTSSIDKKFDCILLVNQAANNPDSIKNLFSIVQGIEFQKVNREDSQDVYDNLKYFADQNPDAFALRVNNYKNKVSKVFEKLKSYNAFDLTKDGHIAAGLPADKKSPIMSNVPGKGQEMLDYAFNNYLKPEIYEGIEKLTQIAEKIK